MLDSMGSTAAGMLPRRRRAKPLGRQPADLHRVAVLGAADELGAGDLDPVLGTAQVAHGAAAGVVVEALAGERRATAVGAAGTVVPALSKPLAKQSELEVGGGERRQQTGHGRLFVCDRHVPSQNWVCAVSSVAGATRGAHQACAREEQRGMESLASGTLAGTG